MQIRKVQPEDVGRLAEIIVFNNRKNYYPIFNDIEYSFHEFTVPNVMKMFLGDPEFMENCYVFEDVVIKGFVCVVGNEIKKLYVDTFFQGAGAGKALLNFATDKLGGDRLWALEKNTNAIRFYEKNGFRLSGEKCFEEGTTEYLVRMIKE